MYFYLATVGFEPTPTSTAVPSNTETTVISTRPLRFLKKELSWPRFMLDFSALPLGVFGGWGLFVGSNLKNVTFLYTPPTIVIPSLCILFQTPTAQYKWFKIYVCFLCHVLFQMQYLGKFIVRG